MKKNDTSERAILKVSDAQRINHEEEEEEEEESEDDQQPPPEPMFKAGVAVISSESVNITAMNQAAMANQ